VYCESKKQLIVYKKIISYRSYLFGTFWTDLRYRYAGTAIGFYWFIINPLVEITIYTVVFSHLLGFRAPGRDSSYVSFLVTGLFPWLSYTESILKGTNFLIKNAPYLRKMSIPTEIFIAKNSLLSLFSLAIYLLLIFLFLLISNHGFGWSLILLPLLALLMQLSAFGIALITAHLRVLFPDIGEVLPTFLQLWRWLLPILYSYDIFPDLLQKVLKFNPPYYFIDSIRGIFLDDKLPGVESWMHMLLWTFFLISLGYWVSNRLRSEVVDAL